MSKSGIKAPGRRLAGVLLLAAALVITALMSASVKPVFADGESTTAVETTAVAETSAAAAGTSAETTSETQSEDETPTTAATASTAGGTATADVETTAASETTAVSSAAATIAVETAEAASASDTAADGNTAAVSSAAENTTTAETSADAAAASSAAISVTPMTAGVNLLSGRDISTAAVDSISISGDNVQSDGSVNAYTDFTVTVAFSEDDANGNQKADLDITSGDTITVSWTAPEGVTFTGYTETIDLYPNGASTGTKLGTAEVTTTGVTITFNDNVNSLQHVKGSVTFTIQNRGNTASDEGGTGSIISGSVTKEVTINHTDTSGVVDFGSKGGSWFATGEDKIQWTIWINATEQSNLTGDIVITDILPETESNPTLIGYSHRNGGAWNWAVYTLEDFNQNGRTFEYDEATRTITVTIPAAELVYWDEDTSSYLPTAALLRFSTDSTAEAGDTVSNTITMTHYETTDSTTSQVDDEYTGKLTVPSTSGNLSGVEKGTIQITKVVSGTTDPIEGIYFHVYKVVSESDKTRVSGWYNGADYAEIVTDSDGIATISDLIDGYYEIEEVTTNLPNWIATPSITSVYCSIGGTAGTAVEIGNDVKTGSITATKNWTQADGTTADTSDHPTVYFQLYRNGTALTDDDLPDGQTAIQAVATASGESTAEVTWEDLPLYDNSGNAYTYSVKEVDAEGNDYTPDGYTKSENGLTVTNSKNITYSDITAAKKWVQSDGTTADTDDHAAVYFKLYRSVAGGEAEAVDGAEIKAVTTASGESEASVTWEDLPYTDDAGNAYTYSVREVDAEGNDYTPDGYTKSEDGLTVTNTKNPVVTTSEEATTTPEEETTAPGETSTTAEETTTTAEETTATTTAAETTTASAVKVLGIEDYGQLYGWMLMIAGAAVVLILAVAGAAAYRNRHEN